MDNGHIALIMDLQDLLREANAYQFHDFKNTKYATPKVELVKKLNELSNNVKTGKYDN